MLDHAYVPYVSPQHPRAIIGISSDVVPAVVTVVSSVATVFSSVGIVIFSAATAVVSSPRMRSCYQRT